jgi:hypothetical protein
MIELFRWPVVKGSAVAIEGFSSYEVLEEHRRRGLNVSHEARPSVQ